MFCGMWKSLQLISNIFKVSVLHFHFILVDGVTGVVCFTTPPFDS